jgi:DNA-binding CsgD family transcriptional regulator
VRSQHDTRDEIIRLRSEGVGPREIARRLGVNPNSVAGVLFRAGLTSERKGRGYGQLTAAQKAEALELRSFGVPLWEVAHKFGVSQMTIWRLERELIAA